MPRTLVPVNIRPHLVPFLFQEFQGTEAHLHGRKLKAVKISTRNYFGKLIRLLAKKSDKPAACDKRYAIFLSIAEEERRIECFGKVYRYADGRNSFLHIPEEGVVMINEYLEGLFRNSCLFFLDGWVAKQGEQGLNIGILQFIDKYRLLEFGFDPDSMRRNYYRWKKEDSRLKFITVQSSNQVHNYA